MKNFRKVVTLLLIVSMVLIFQPLSVYAESANDVGEAVYYNGKIYGRLLVDKDADWMMPATMRDTDVLHVRKEPDANSECLAEIRLGEDDEFLVLSEASGGWFKVKYYDIIGYLYWQYIDFIEPETDETYNLIGSAIIQYISSENRDTNLAVASNIINGIVINSGEMFNWWDAVGPGDPDLGFVKATVMRNHVAVQDYGGGNCQVSTTLYNATFGTHLEIVERHPHRDGCHYAKEDATVSYGTYNFIFKNTYDRPVRIEAYSVASIVCVNLYLI